MEPKPMILGQIWGINAERALKVLSNALFRGVEAPQVPKLCVDLSINVKLGKMWPLMTFDDLWSDQKWLEYVRYSYALLIAAYRVTL